MSERMAIVPRTELTDDMLISGVAANQERMVADIYTAMIAASPNAGKLSQAQITAAIDAMKDCGLPYMPWQRREIIVQIVAKSFGLEIE